MVARSFSVQIYSKQIKTHSFIYISYISFDQWQFLLLTVIIISKIRLYNN